LFLAGIFEFGEGLLHARNAHGEGGWLKELSVPRVGTVGYFCSASLMWCFTSTNENMVYAHLKPTRER
ncbi:hypothetical protein, partial [Pseudomonas syringae]|uniref:hypothetical protein n=1 Tax=Pseudomonas syringae TaxID=317 RepID=UPI001C558A8B